MKVVLPDESTLELPDGANGPRRGARDRAEARRAGRARALERLRAGPADAASGRAADPDPHHPRQGRSRRALRPAPLGRAPPRGGRAPPLPGREDRDRAADRERLLLRLRVPGADPRGGPRADRGGGQPRARRGARMDANRDHGRRGARALRGGGRALQGRARGHRGGADHALHAGRLHRPLPRPAPPELGADQGDQAPLARGRVLARRRAQPTADAGLRHRLLLAGGPRRVPRADRGGEEARPPPARHPARPLPPLRRLARLAVLASRRGWCSGTRSRISAGART